MEKTVAWITDRPACVAQMLNGVFPPLWEKGVVSYIGVLNSSASEVERLSFAFYDAWASTGVSLGYTDAEMKEFEKLVRRRDTTSYGADTVKLLNYPCEDKDEWTSSVIFDFPDDSLYGIDIALRSTTPESLIQSINLYKALMEINRPAFLFNTLVAPTKSTHLWYNTFEAQTGIDVSNMPVYDRRGRPIEKPVNTPRLVDFIVNAFENQEWGSWR